MQFAGFLFLFAAAAPKTSVTYKVCTSPACVADGSQATLDALRALLSSCGKERVSTAGCSSACGKGPVVLVDKSDDTTTTTTRTTTHRHVNGIAKILELLQENEEPLPDENVVEGYQQFVQAEQRLQSKQYAEAIALYQTSVDLIRSLPDAASAGDWVAVAYRNQASAYLLTMANRKKSVEAALEAAQRACSLCPDSALNYKVLATVYQSMGNDAEELRTLQHLVNIPDYEEGGDVNANEKREVSFRIARLTKLLSDD